MFLADINWAALGSIAAIGTLIVTYYAIYVPLAANRREHAEQIIAQRNAATSELLSKLETELSIFSRATVLEASIDPEDWAEKHRAVTEAVPPLTVGVAFGADYEEIMRSLSTITRAIQSLRDLCQQRKNGELTYRSYANRVASLVAKTYTFAYAPLLKCLGAKEAASSLLDQGDALDTIVEGALIEDELLELLRNELDETEPLLSGGHIDSGAWRNKHTAVASAVRDALGNRAVQAWRDEYRNKLLEAVRIADEGIANYERVDKTGDPDTVYLNSLRTVGPVLKIYASMIELYGDSKYANNVRIQHAVATARRAPGLLVLLRDDVEALRPLLRRQWIDPVDWERRSNAIRNRAAGDDILKALGGRYTALSAAVEIEAAQLLDYREWTENGRSGEIGREQIWNAVRTFRGYEPFIDVEEYTQQILGEILSAISVTVNANDPEELGKLMRSALEARERDLYGREDR